ncbi:MAG: hypothetical protein JNM68_04965 [Dinghuibacter sp.]|nr:hypothetical protein [Dinghuibacter sp.]
MPDPVTASTLTVGGGGTNGIIKVFDSADVLRASFYASSHSLKIYDAAGNLLVSLGVNGNLTLGGTGSDGDLMLKTSSGVKTVHLDGGNGNLTLGADGSDGDLYVTDNTGATTIYLDGGNGNITLGGNGHDGDLMLANSSGTNTVVMSGDSAALTLGGTGTDGDLYVTDDSGATTIYLDGGNGNITLGGNGHDGDLTLQNSDGDNTIVLNGDTGDITLNNADFAEDFTIAEEVEIVPGMVMVINQEGVLEPCSEAYDTRAAGVVSGAGIYKPGIIMDKQADAANRYPISLMGKVMCCVDAGYGPVMAGDLLTCSPTPGHAMRANRERNCTGAIIGKALSSCLSGTGMVKMLITLQ